MATKVAAIILEQLGGARFTFITGARDYVASDNKDGTGYLQMRLPAIRRFMKITLTADDTYTLFLYSVVNHRVREHERRVGVYVENLRETFTRLTGLETYL